MLIQQTLQYFCKVGFVQVLLNSEFDSKNKKKIKDTPPNIKKQKKIRPLKEMDRTNVQMNKQIKVKRITVIRFNPAIRTANVVDMKNLKAIFKTSLKKK